jgi:hypothetical protein
MTPFVRFALREYAMFGDGAASLPSFVLLFFAGAVDVMAFFLRSVLVGDEDEFNAMLRRDILKLLREGRRPREAEMSEAEDSSQELLDDLLARHTNRFADAPPPPIAEFEGAVDAEDAGLEPAG